MSSINMDVSIDQLRALPLEKRLEILEALWETVESECGSEGISEEFGDELERRYQEHVADPSSSLSWEEVRAAVRRQLARSRIEAPPLSAEERAEIERRIAEHKRNPGAAMPVDAFLDELDRRYAIMEEVLDEAEREFEAHLADPSSSIPWETVRARLRERYG